MKAIMMSIRPEWVTKILNGEKTIEIRKTLPKCDLPIDVFIYCTKGSDFYEFHRINDKKWCKQLSGKVVAKFTLNKVEELRPFFHWCKELEKATCLTRDDVLDYLDSKDKFVGNPKMQGKVYAWHIDNLVVFDKPKELSEFKHYTNDNDCKKCAFGSRCNLFPCERIPLTKAPQSWCYVEL